MIECATAADMHARFVSTSPFQVAWFGCVWEVPRCTGWVRDATTQRFYVKFLRSEMQQVTEENAT